MKGPPDTRVSKTRKPRQRFSKEEDEKIKSLVIKYNKTWHLVANEMKDRTARQIRERYVNYLDPYIKQNNWSPEEDALLERLEKQYEQKWSKIVIFFPDRTDVMLKNRAALLRRHRKKSAPLVFPMIKEVTGSSGTVQLTPKETMKKEQWDGVDDFQMKSKDIDDFQDQSNYLDDFTDFSFFADM